MTNNPVTKSEFPALQFSPDIYRLFSLAMRNLKILRL